MSGAAFLRVQKLVGQSIVKAAAKHNKRAIARELGVVGGSIDPVRCGLNYALAGPSTACEVAELASRLMADAGITKLRKDAVRAIEVVCSLPVGTQIDSRAYFSECVQWVSESFGGHVLAADVHLDEAAPHLHVLALPLVGGRMVGSDLVGGIGTLKARQRDFHETIAQPYGLNSKPVTTKQGKGKVAKAVIERLRATNDPVLQSAAWAMFREAIEQSPIGFAMALGLDVEDEKPKSAKLKTMAQIFTKPVKAL